MGCDIHVCLERKNPDGKYDYVDGLDVLDYRSYDVFAFLAGVRNYSAIPPIAMPRGMPDNANVSTSGEYSHWGWDAHSASWLSVAELLAFDYDAPCEDRRCTRQTGPNSFDGGCTADVGEGKQTTFREFLGEQFFEDLQKLHDNTIDRIVFWFDN